MEPLQTWWATELYPSKDDENFGVAGDFEVVKAADAQATIAALHDVIKQMGEQAAVIAKDAMAAKEQVAALQARVKELESDPYKQGFIDALGKVGSDWASKEFRGHDEIQSCEVQAFLDTRHVHYEECRGVKPLQSQLTQRTAELEAARRERDEWIVKWDEHDHYPKGYVTAQIQLRERVQAELERVRGELAEAHAQLKEYY